jgi:flavin-dependent thymidylate synthase
MKVTLVSYTPDAMNVLILTKNTRLGLNAGRLAAIIMMPIEDKLKELEYMANTIPSSWEFVDYIFLVEGVSRAYTHQQVRTRTGSYAQESLRVVEKRNIEYIYPVRHDTDRDAVIDSVVHTIELAYQMMLEKAVPIEDARGILPTNIATNIVCKFNLRTLAELARSRTGGRTQGEYIAVINAMIDAVLEVHPWAELFLFPKGRDHFADIEAFAEREFGGDLARKGELLKIVDKLRKGDD